MPTLLLFLLPLIILAISIAAVLIYFKKFIASKKTQDEAQNIVKSGEEDMELIHNAIKRSQDILSNAQLQGVKIISDRKNQTEQLEGRLEEQFIHTLDDSEKSLNHDLDQARNEIVNAQKDYIAFLNELKTQSLQAQKDNQDLIKQQINSIFFKFEENLINFLTQAEQKSVSTIDLELKATRNLIETYQQEQLKIIDDNIIEIIEKTLSLVLAKKLTFSDHADLVYESLEKAKMEKLIL